MDKVLPAENPMGHRKQPWLLHMLDVNALNFCTFAMCFDQGVAWGPENQSGTCDDDVPRPVLIAVPNAIDSGGVRNICSSNVVPR